MTHTLITFLGTSAYVPVRYDVDGRTTETPQAFFCAAFVESCTPKPDRVVVLATEQAEERNGEALRACLGELEVVRIPAGATESELWEIFAAVERVVEGQVTLDLTHGFRSLPLIGCLAVGFARQVREVASVRVVYGAFEALGKPPQVVKAEVEATGEVPVAPMFDLTPMFELPAWSEAMAEWRRTGRADGLTGQLDPTIRLLQRELKAACPKDLKALPRKLEAFSEVVGVLKHDQLGGVAREARESLAEVQASIEEYAPNLAPFVTAMGSIQADLEGVTATGYLREQAAFVGWLLGRRRLVEAVLLLRELGTSIAVEIAQLAGVQEVVVSGERRGPTHHEFRGTVDGLLSRYLEGKEGVRPDQWEVRDRLVAWLGARRECWGRLKRLLVTLSVHRNKLSHTWTREEFSQQRVTSKTVSGLRSELEGILAEAVEVIEQLEGEEPVEVVAREPVVWDATGLPEEEWAAVFEGVGERRALEVSEVRAGDVVTLGGTTLEVARQVAQLQPLGARLAVRVEGGWSWLMD